MEEKNQAIESDSRIYEVGFHIVPIVAEENLGEEVEFIRDAIKSSGGSIISEDHPTRLDLAYPISSEISGDRKTFDQAYFAWVKFETNPESLSDLKKLLYGRDSILRYLIVKTIRENTFVPREARVAREDRLHAEETGRSSEVENEEEPRKLTEEDKKAIDDSIEEMVSEESEE